MPDPLRIRPFRFADIAAVAPSAEFARELDCAGSEALAPLAYTVGFTLERGADLEPRTVLACGGARPRRGGWWSAWMIADDLTHREWRMILDAGRRLFAFLEEAYQATHIEILVRLDFPEGDRFARKLGFAPTGDLSERGGVAYRSMVREAGD